MQMIHSRVRGSRWLAAWQRLARTGVPVAEASAPERDLDTHGIHYLLAEDPPARAETSALLAVPRDAKFVPEQHPLPQVLVVAQNGRAYRAPTDLQRTELPIRRVLVIGSCLACGWISENNDSGAIFDYILTNNFSPLPESPPAAIAEYDFQLVQIPLRSFMHENTYSHLPPTRAAYDDLFASVTTWLSQYLDIALAWNTKHGLLTFVSNFLVPQQNPLGRLFARNDKRPYWLQ